MMNYKEFIETHKPIINNLDVKAEYDGTLFKNEGEDLAFVYNIAIEKGAGYMCMIIKEDDKHYVTIHAGHRTKVGYFVLTHPFHGEDILIEL